MLLLDGDGQMFPVGQHVVRYRSDFHLGSIPAWLVGSVSGNNASATYTANPSAISGSIPHLLMATDAVTNKRATILGPALDTAAVRRVRVDVTTLGGADSNTVNNGKSIFFGFGDNPESTNVNSCRLRAEANVFTTVPLQVHKASAEELLLPTGYAWRSAISGSEQPIHQLSMILDYVHQSVHIFSRDQEVIGTYLGDDMPSGVQRPHLMLLATQAAVRTLQVLQFDVTVEY